MQFALITALFHVMYLAVGPSERKMEYRTGKNVVYMLHLHLVFVPRYWRDVLSERLMHFVQMVLNFDKMSRQINHDLEDADGV